GTDLVRVLAGQHQLVPLSHADVEVTEPASIDAVLHKVQPELVMNMAAFHQVDRCEEQAELAFTVNALGPRNLAIACRTHGAALLHMSSDYVFGGDRSRAMPFVESDVPAPINAYGVSKLAGE